MTGIFTAATLEEAKQKAAAAFGTEVSELNVKVLEEPKRSLLGLFGKKDEYKIEASYTPATPVSDAEPEEEAQPEAAAVISQKEIVPEAAPEAPAVQQEAVQAEEKELSAELQTEKLEIGKAYLEQVLAVLAPDTTVESRLENGITFELKGQSAGTLIGRRGDTLDALQYLVSIIANRGDKDYVRVSIDTCGYREKRKKALQELAQRISKNVLRTGRSVALEPMNPYERRIIHSTVTEIEGVSSHSAGEEPNRKVIITNDSAPDYKKDDRNARSYSGNGGRYRDRNDRSRGDRGDRFNKGRGDKRHDRYDRKEHRPTGEGPRKLDLSTSFEKDYKRPKPEDSLNTGVYGKIEI